MADTRKRLLRGWWLFTANATYFCKMRDGQQDPPKLDGETARVTWQGKRWPKPIQRRATSEKGPKQPMSTELPEIRNECT
jgi:hypothetical protein